MEDSSASSGGFPPSANMEPIMDEGASNGKSASTDPRPRSAFPSRVARKPTTMILLFHKTTSDLLAHLLRPFLFVSFTSLLSILLIPLALNMLEADVKKEYLEALEAVPALVATESAKAKFLRVEQNNPWKAARRLAMYWKFRKEIGGEDRWLRPMTATGNGVLGTKEVELLRRGIYHYSHTPGYGPVLVVDGSRNKGATIETCDMVVFYLASILDDVAIQTEGVSIVYAVTSDDTESRISNRLGMYVAFGLPVRIRRFLVVQNYEPGREALCEYLAVRRKLQVDMNMGGGGGANGCELVTSDQSRSDLLSAANRAGIPWSALPKACGGRFGQDVLCDWLRQRMSVEDCLSLNTTSRTVVVPFHCHNKNNNPQRLVVSRKRKASTDTTTTSGGRSGSWKYFRDALQQQAERLRQNNLVLQADNRRLEELLLQARKVSLEHQMAAMTGNPSMPQQPPQQQSASTQRLQSPFPTQTSIPTTATTVSPILRYDDPSSSSELVMTRPVRMGPPRPPQPQPLDDYLFGVDVADPFEQMGDNELAQFILLSPR
eukprot:scaffold1690_cov182-Amphora_coffeaeformis.AAC.36